MKYYISIFALLIATVPCHAQRRVTKQDIENINNRIENKIDSLRKVIYSNDSYGNNDLQFMFQSDTLRINVMMAAKMHINSSTSGMNNAVYDAEEAYDMLLNKYYQILLRKLDSKDQEILRAAQRSWIEFRNNERKLNVMLTKIKYSGGGSIQSNFIAGAYFELTRERVVDFYHHLVGMIN